MEDFVFISPDYSEIRLVPGADRDDAVEGFQSLMFEQGKSSNEVDWLVFEKGDTDDLKYAGRSA